MDKNYRLINKETNEATICEKVVIGDFDYYQVKYKSDLPFVDGCLYIYNSEMICTYKKEFNRSAASASYNKRILATNNLSLDLPIVIDELDYLSERSFENDSDTQFAKDWYEIGYNKSKETYSFSKEDMLEFGKFCHNDAHSTDRIRYVRVW